MHRMYLLKVLMEHWLFFQKIGVQFAAPHGHSQPFVAHAVWGLETEPSSSAKAAKALDH